MEDEVADVQLEQLVSRRAATRLRAFRRDAERAFPGQVVRVLLFGSRARGEARRDSDYDVAIFLRDLVDRRSTGHALADLAYPHLIEGYHINPVALPDDYLERGDTGSLRFSIARDGIAVT